jgi:hypothetical protein
MEVHMRKGVIVGVGTVLGLFAGVSDASACRRSGYCGGAPGVAYWYGPPPTAYGYLPPPAPYGYVPSALVYSWAPPRYAPAYGYRGWRDCNRGYGGYGYAPPVAYDDDGYQPAAIWAPGR